MERTVEILKAMAEDNRLRILILLEQAGELSVADIGSALELPQPKVSRHLGRLRLAGWVKERRWRGFAMYRIYLGTGTLHREYMIRILQDFENDPVIAMDIQRLVALKRTGTHPAPEVDKEGEGEAAASGDEPITSDAE